MHHIIYLSQAATALLPSELVSLLMEARRHNEELHITGALVYGDNQFMQVIEGEKRAVTDLYARIAEDPRHRNIFKLADKAIEERTFLNWSMAFRQVEESQFADLTGYMSPGQFEQLAFVNSGADDLLLEKMKELVLSVRPPT